MMTSCESIEIPSDNPNSYCRLCFSDRNLVSLSANDADSEKFLLEQISQCTGIEINPTADLPCSICWRCAVALEDFHFFRQRSLKHDAIVRGVHVPTSNSIEEDSHIISIKQEEETTCVPTSPQEDRLLSSDHIDNDLLMVQKPLHEDTEATASDMNDENNAELLIPVKTFTCHICQTKFSGQQSLSVHFKEQHSDRGRPFKCSYCPATFKRKHHAENHMSSHTGEMRYSCKDCGAKYAKSKSLIRHRQQFHHSVPVEQTVKIPKIIGQFQCAYCPKSFKHRPSLNFHVKSHYDILPHVCEICDARFGNEKGLRVHKGKYHSIETFSVLSASPNEVHECMHCPRTFDEQRYLTQHIRFMHQSSWPEYHDEQVFTEEPSMETQSFDEPDQTIDEFQPATIKTEVEDNELLDGFGM
ncbi:transcription factor E4F1-like isoform X2 [Toxorhynchites rutilus septentrionalis]|uniref:transcription factor E4F1-like isoform X2 n=1 Tax=Toxorhynchites rutilus septentrionalis TaxID=329112 RepID=UPI0024790636|nr:transcription factor E4F1-like isoform X2 [Toxorhynchites rutilus septentrionalis]